MPYRIVLDGQPADAFDALLGLGALDVDVVDGHLVAILPDEVTTAEVAQVVRHAPFRIEPARGRDDGSVWVVRAPVVCVGSIQIVPADTGAVDAALQLEAGPAFGTGLHPTTALCLEALELELRASGPVRVLDVGTGSGVLALSALLLGASHAVAIDTDVTAVAVAAENARRNALGPRLHLVCGGPDVLSGNWPLVCANILAAPLIQMAPALSRLVGHRGRLLLSGIRSSMAGDVDRAYRRVGMRPYDDRARGGWTALGFQASW